MAHFSAPSGPQGPALPAETRLALQLCAGLLGGLLVAKQFGSVPWLGPALLSLAAFAQLYVPMWRCERHAVPYAAVGLSTQHWRRDLGLAAGLGALVLPLYGLGVHLYLTQAHGWLLRCGWGELAAGLPVASFAPVWPAGGRAWGLAVYRLGELMVTHVLGVALPEETFYRGYLQAQLQLRWPPRGEVAGTPVGLAALLAAALFAGGHFLGEWHPGRLAPFFPALLFAWLRNRTGTTLGAIAFHGGCNVFSALWFACYR